MASEDMFRQQSAPTPAPATGSTEGKSDGTDELVQYDENKGNNLSPLFLWIAAIFSIVGTAYIWFASSSVAQALSDKKTEKDSVIAEIVSPTYVDVESKATSFKSSVDQMQVALAARYSMSDFLPKFYANIDKKTTVSNLSISDDGKLTFDGLTDSYKSVAEQIATLTAWSVGSNKVLSDVKLLSVSEDTSSGVVVKFALSAQVDKTVDLKTVADTSATTDAVSAPATTGGN